MENICYFFNPRETFLRSLFDGLSLSDRQKKAFLLNLQIRLQARVLVKFIWRVINKKKKTTDLKEEIERYMKETKWNEIDQDINMAELIEGEFYSLIDEIVVNIREDELKILSNLLNK